MVVSRFRIRLIHAATVFGFRNTEHGSIPVCVVIGHEINLVPILAEKHAYYVIILK